MNFDRMIWDRIVRVEDNKSPEKKRVARQREGLLSGKLNIPYVMLAFIGSKRRK